jgi:RimJ/RimL family protein N-acetyltransferase
MVSPRLHLRCPQIDDAHALHAAVAESIADLRRYIGTVPWVAQEPSLQNSEAYCRQARENFPAGSDMPFLLFTRDSSALVGCVGLHRPDWSVPKFEIGYWCRSGCTGRGYIAEAVDAVVAMAEAELDAARIELITDAQNEKSRAVAGRCGFVLEGVLRNERRGSDGTLRDTCVYARCATRSRENG